MFSERFFKLAVSIANNTERINTRKRNTTNMAYLQSVIITFIYNSQIH